MIQNNIVFDNIFDTEDTKAGLQNKERASPVYFCHRTHPERWNVTNGKYIWENKLGMYTVVAFCIWVGKIFAC